MMYLRCQSFFILACLLCHGTTTTLKAAARQRADSIASTASSQTLPDHDDSLEIRRTRSGREGNTTLHIACTKSTAATVWALTTCKPDDVDARNYREQTPLMLACQHNLGLTAVTALIAAGANPTAHDILGATVLHYACERENIEVVSFLLTEYNVPITFCLSKEFPGSSSKNDGIKALVKHHRDEQGRKRMEALADAAYVELGKEDIADMPQPDFTEAKEEGYEVV